MLFGFTSWILMLACAQLLASRTKSVNILAMCLTFSAPVGILSTSAATIDARACMTTRCVLVWRVMGRNANWRLSSTSALNVRPPWPRLCSQDAG